MGTFEQGFSTIIHGQKRDVWVIGEFEYSSPEPQTYNYPGCPSDIALYLNVALLEWGKYSIKVTEGRLFNRLYEEVQESQELMDLVLTDMKENAVDDYYGEI